MTELCSNFLGPVVTLLPDDQEVPGSIPGSAVEFFTDGIYGLGVSVFQYF